MEKKPNIKTLAVKLDGREMPFISSPDHKGKILDHYQHNSYSKEEIETYCNGIVTAVNCTYGANINPEKIGETVHVLEEIEHHVRNGYEMPLWLKTKLNEALNDIKYIEPIKLGPGMEGPFPKENKY